MDQNPNIFLTRSKNHIQDINRHFDGTLNNFYPTVFVENQEQNESYTFNDFFLKIDKSDFILAIIKAIESYKNKNN